MEAVGAEPAPFGSCRRGAGSRAAPVSLCLSEPSCNHRAFCSRKLPVAVAEPGGRRCGSDSLAAQLFSPLWALDLLCRKLPPSSLLQELPPKQRTGIPHTQQHAPQRPSESESKCSEEGRGPQAPGLQQVLNTPASASLPIPIPPPFTPGLLTQVRSSGEVSPAALSERSPHQANSGGGTVWDVKGPGRPCLSHQRSRAALHTAPCEFRCTLRLGLPSERTPTGWCNQRGFFG
ncbi:PREDICTED: uncharacterized protein LOC106148746 [Chinchilla lanigera]|uniref:uncharacterized protein LOC106148746 n=1 Tax=Chinchilla lanigera TaxID=34839 RepID=UPI000697C12A|nr:PREDICTED: uncharacterized protein LOC106148746 [Chinchilla lanigera]